MSPKRYGFGISLVCLSIVTLFIMMATLPAEISPITTISAERTTAYYFGNQIAIITLYDEEGVVITAWNEQTGYDQEAEILTGTTIDKVTVTAYATYLYMETTNLEEIENKTRCFLTFTTPSDAVYSYGYVMGSQGSIHIVLWDAKVTFTFEDVGYCLNSAGDYDIEIVYQLYIE